MKIIRHCAEPAALIDALPEASIAGVAPPPTFAAPPTRYLDGLPDELLRRIADCAAHGAPMPSRLAMTSRTLRRVLGPRAMSDKLHAASDAGSRGEDPVRYYASLIVLGSAMQPLATFELLRRLPPRICRDTGVDSAERGALFDRLRKVIATQHVPCHRLEASTALAEVIIDPLQSGDVTAPAAHPLMQDFYRAFIDDAGGLADGAPGGEGAPRTVTQCVGVESSTAVLAVAPAKASRLRASLCGGLARGLYLSADPNARARLWDRLFDDTGCGSGDERMALLEGLTSALPNIESHAQRGKNFEALVGEMKSLSGAMQGRLLARLVPQLRMLEPEAREDVFSRLLEIGCRLPVLARSAAIPILIDHLPQLPPHCHAAQFARIHAHALACPPHESGAVLVLLAQTIHRLPLAAARSGAFDLIWHSLQQPILQDKACTGDVIGGLGAWIGAIACLPDPFQRRAGFAAAVQAVAPLPMASREVLIGQLIDAIPVLADEFAPVHAQNEDAILHGCDLVLSLVAGQPDACQPGHLHALHQHLRCRGGSDFTARLVAALHTGCVRQSSTAQAELIGESATSAVRLAPSHLAECFEMLATAAQALPTPCRLQAESHIVSSLQGFLHATQSGSPAHFATAIRSVLATCDRLPEEMVIGLMPNLLHAVRALRSPQRAGLSDALAQCLRRLPPSARTMLRATPPSIHLARLSLT